MTTRGLLHLLFCGAILACGGRQASDGGAVGAIVVRGADLSGDLLSGLRTRIPTMTVSTPVGQCPRIIFRGQRSMRNQGDPTVYVDGTRMHDTCMLLQIPSADVDYVEVYPSGNTSRTDVQRNPFGLILVFRHRG